MKFLESLYSNENFGIYLFAIIAILVILFFIILFFGKKDEKILKKKQKDHSESNEEIQSTTVEPPSVEITPALTPKIDQPEPEATNQTIINGFKEVTEEVPLEIHVQDSQEQPIKPVIEEQEEPLNFSNVVLNSNLVEKANESQEVEEKQQASDILKKEFDFDALADAISKELDTINRNNKTSEQVEEKIEPKEAPVIEEKPFVFPTFEPVKADEIPEEIMKESEKVEEKKPEPKEKPVMPTVFSSVYVNRDNELKTSEKTEEKQEETEEPHPTKPQFELPKMVELPKKIQPEEKVEPKETFTINNEFKNEKKNF